MYRKFMLALPLASLLFVVGCSCVDDTCNTCVGGTVYAAVEKETPAAEPVVAIAKVEKVEETKAVATMTEEEFKTLAKAAPVEKVEKKAEEPAPAPAVAVQSQGYCPSRIPGMPLPEGWQYMSESDLSNGRLNNIAYDQEEYFSQVANAKRNDI